MRQRLIVLFLTLAVLFGCNSRMTNSNENNNCNFEFEIKQESSIAYNYNSKTGLLNKLIDPFKSDPIYADTVFKLPNEAICKIKKLYLENDIYDLAKDFKPKNDGIQVTPEPKYQLKFITQDSTKEINWSRNTVLVSRENEDAKNLKAIINLIDSLILSTPEFKSLPKGEYMWL